MEFNKVRPLGENNRKHEIQDQQALLVLGWGVRVYHQAGVLRMLVYAGGSSTVSGSALSPGIEGPASSC